MIASMTGFARAQNTPAVKAPAGRPCPPSWNWELRSVNGRGLDVRMRLPPGYEALEIPACDMVAKTLSRGTVSATLRVRSDDSGDSGQVVNWPFLRQLMDLGKNLPPHVAPPTLDGLLRVRGVLLAAEDQTLPPEARQAHEAAVLAGLGEAVRSLAEARVQEGMRLLEVLGGHLETIFSLTTEAAQTAALRPQALRERIRRHLDDLLDGSGLSEERLLHEAALIATRLDVREELDRLHAHVSQARDLLAAGGACGRRLDFLCQEFNREANTLCSKSQDSELTRIGLALKAAIDQFREQIQKIE